MRHWERHSGTKETLTGKKELEGAPTSLHYIGREALSLRFQIAVFRRCSHNICISLIPHQSEFARCECARVRIEPLIRLVDQHMADGIECLLAAAAAADSTAIPATSSGQLQI